MSGVPPVGPPGGAVPLRPVETEDRRDSDRRQSDRRASVSRALVPVDDPDGTNVAGPARPAPTAPPDAQPSAFAAQMIGQPGQKRGLRGGPPVLDSARSSYLGAEYSGEAERRPAPGRVKDTDV